MQNVAQCGVLAAHLAVRAEIVPGREPPPATVQLALFAASDDSPLEPPPSRPPWDWLLRPVLSEVEGRVFAVDVGVCPVTGCEGRMRLVEIATAPDDIARVLDHRPPRARAPPRPRAPGQLLLAFD